MLPTRLRITHLPLLVSRSRSSDSRHPNTSLVLIAAAERELSDTSLIRLKRPMLGLQLAYRCTHVRGMRTAPAIASHNVSSLPSDMATLLKRVPFGSAPNSTCANSCARVNLVRGEGRSARREMTGPSGEFVTRPSSSIDSIRTSVTPRALQIAPRSIGGSSCEPTVSKC